jgi:short-subunit dehydrogenase
VADICVEADRVALSQWVLEARIERIINLVGVNQLARFEQQSSAQIAAMVDTNLTSVMLLVQSLLPSLQALNKPTDIVLVGSTLGAIGMPGYVPYCASKFGLRGFAQALERELADSTVSCRYFAPRTTRTDMNDERADAMNSELGNHADSPEAVAKALVRFLGKRRPEQHLGWPEKLFVRINGVLPQLVSKSLAKQLPIMRKYIG